jgi:two-component system, OmpR family, response regulator RegX3
MRILLVEDDQPATERLTYVLTRLGHHVEWVRSGAKALVAAGADFVLLARTLPDMDGLDVLRELRAAGDVPVIMRTCGPGTDRIVCLELGADDVVSPAIDPSEVHARMRAVLRRARTGAVERRERHGRITIDRRSHRVYRDGRTGTTEVALTPREYALLAFLTEEPGAPVTREEVMRQVWDSHWFGSTKTLDAHIAALRRKLGDALGIETIRGVGFRTEAS